MGRLSLNENIKKTMKTEPRKGRRPVTPIPAALDNTDLTRSDNDSNNNKCVITSLINDMDKLTVDSENAQLQKPVDAIAVSVQTNDKCNELNCNIGTEGSINGLTEELINKISEINIAGEDDSQSDRKETNIAESELENQNESEAHDSSEGNDEDLCSRGPSRHAVCSDHRTTNLPYQVIHPSTRNRTSCGGVVFAGQLSETIDISQLSPYVFNYPPSYLDGQSPIDSPISEEEVWKHIDEVMGSPEKRDHMCAFLEEVSKTSVCLDTPTLLELNKPLSGGDKFYPSTSPQLYQSQRSPNQVVPSPSGWQDPYSVPSNFSHSPSSSFSSPTSPYEVPSSDSTTSTYLEDDPSSFIDFAVPDNLVEYLDSLPLTKSNINKNNSTNINNKSSIQTSGLLSQPVYTPILCPPSPDQSSTASTSHVPLISISGPPENLHNLTFTSCLTSVTSQSPVMLPGGYSQKVQTVTSSSPQPAYIRPQTTTLNIYMPVVDLLTSQSQPRSQSRPKPRPRPILPAPKPTNVPCKEELLKCLNPQRKKNMWMKVNFKPKEELIQGDKDGDTLLMISVSQVHDNLFESLYAIVEYLRKEAPEVLHKKNKSGQTALYNACVALPQHPLVARFLAETMLSLDINISEDKYEEGISLLECVRQRGPSHSDILTTLLNLKTAKGNHVFRL